jgi:hypothetical protein
MRLRLITLASLFALQCLNAMPARADIVHVLSLDSSRGLDLASNPGFGIVRGDLLDPTLFGPSGVVPRSVQFLPSVSTITPASLAGVDVVTWSASSVSPSELTALSTFVNNGGGLLFFNNNPSIFASLVGATPGGNANATNVTIIDAASPLANGPFGSLGLGSTFLTQYHGYLSTVGPNGLAAMSDGIGIFGASFLVGSGRVALLGDEESFLSSSPGIPAAPSLSPNSRLVFDNSFAFVVPTSAVPEPSSFTLGIVGLVAVFAFLKRSVTRGGP